MSIRIVRHVPIGKYSIIWYQIGVIPMLPLTIMKPLQPLQLSLRPQEIPIQSRRSGPSQSRQKIGGGIGGVTKALIILVGIAVPNIIIYAFRDTYVCRK